MYEESTNEILNSLQADIGLELTDARNQNDRVAASVLQRIMNALQRNTERRTLREQAETNSVDAQPVAPKPEQSAAASAFEGEED